MWRLTPENGEQEVGLLEHDCLGFSQLIPGHPFVAEDRSADSAIGELALGDLPIRVSYRAEIVGWMAHHKELALAMLEGYVQERRRGRGHVQSISPALLNSWGVAGAARTYYVSRDQTAIEFALLMLKGGFALWITCWYPRQQLDWKQWAVFESAFLHKIAWNNALHEPADFWPESPFLVPGVKAMLQPHCQQMVEPLAVDIMHAGSQDHFRDIRRKLQICVVDYHAPTHMVSRRVREDLKEFLTHQEGNLPLRNHIRSQLEKVKTAHDLRGMAIFFDQVIDQVLRWRQGLA